MIHLDLRSALCDLRDAICPKSPDYSIVDGRHVKQCEGIVFNLDIRFNDFINDEEKKSNHRINVLFFGNTSVFWKYEEDKWTDAKFTANHDSCWRSDGMNFLSTIYFDSCEEVNDSKKPIDINQFTTFSSYKPFSLVNVTWDKDPWDKNRYKRILVDIKPK